MTAYIDIRLFATLARFLPDDARQYAIDDGLTVRDLLARLKVPEQKAKLIFVNGIRAELSSRLHDGDRVGIFPPVGGG